MKEPNTDTATVYTYQSPKVLASLERGETYVADFSRAMLGNGAFEELARIVGIENCPIFGGLSKNDTTEMAEASGIDTVNKALICLEVPSDEIHKMGYYDWSDYIYYWVDDQEQDTLTKEQAEDTLRNCAEGNRPCQVVIDRIEPEWLINGSRGA